MKYVVIEIIDQTETGEFVREIPVVFPGSMVHSEVAAAITRVLRKNHPDGRTRQIKPVAAGFINSPDLADIECHGESESLGGLKSRGRADVALIAMNDYYHGIPV